MAAGELSEAAKSVTEWNALYGRELHRFLVQRLRAGEDAKDIAQEVYLNLLKVRHKDLIQKPLAYIYRTATRICRRHQKRAARQPQATEDEVLDRLANLDLDPLAEDMADREHIVRECLRLMTRLDKRHRQIYILKHCEEFSVAEIAAQLQMPEGSVKRYLVRASARLKEARHR